MTRAWPEIVETPKVEMMREYAVRTPWPGGSPRSLGVGETLVVARAVTADVMRTLARADDVSAKLGTANASGRAAEDGELLAVLRCDRYNRPAGTQE